MPAEQSERRGIKPNEAGERKSRGAVHISMWGSWKKSLISSNFLHTQINSSKITIVSQSSAFFSSSLAQCYFVVQFPIQIETKFQSRSLASWPLALLFPSHARKSDFFLLFVSPTVSIVFTPSKSLY